MRRGSLRRRRRCGGPVLVGLGGADANPGLKAGDSDDGSRGSCMRSSRQGGDSKQGEELRLFLIPGFGSVVRCLILNVLANHRNTLQTYRDGIVARSPAEPPIHLDTLIDPVR